jgi:hypothetical protein
MPLITQHIPLRDTFVIDTPALLQGPMCYVDASIDLDQTNPTLRPAGLGVLILNF